MPEVALSEVLGALSYALDITEGEPPGHAVRTTAIGMRLAEEIGLAESARSSLFYALLLKDAGCSSNASRLSDLFGADDREAKRAMKLVDWSRPGARTRYLWRSVRPGDGVVAKARQLQRLAGEGELSRGLIGARCERGADIARMLELPDDTADAIAALDEHWDGEGQPAGLRGEQIPLLGRVLCLAQTVEVFVRMGGLAAGIDMAVRRRGRWFDPALVDALLRTRHDAGFWGPLERSEAVPTVAAWEPADRVRTAGEEQLDRVAEAFARVIDAKSPYTARHSSEVARWGVLVGTELGFGSAALRDLRRAGLLHDIGKLAVSNRILDKPGKLDEAEFAVVRRHPRYTQQILERIACFRGIVDTAANHHERLDGKGYHRGLSGRDLTLPARILAVADVYEALTAERPYRGAMPREQALGIMRGMCGTALCEASVDALVAASAKDAAPKAEPSWTATLAAPRQQGQSLRSGTGARLRDLTPS